MTKQGWLQEGLAYRGLPEVDPGPIPEEIYAYDDDTHDHKEGAVHFDGHFLPVWQMAGAPVNASIINLDLLTRSTFEHTMVDAIEQREGILSCVSDLNYLTENSVQEDLALSFPEHPYPTSLRELRKRRRGRGLCCRCLSLAQLLR